MIVTTVAFGRLWRIECDTLACKSRVTIPAGARTPSGWYVDDKGVAHCPIHHFGQPLNPWSKA